MLKLRTIALLTFQVGVKYNQFRPFVARNIDVQYIGLDKGLLLEDLSFNKIE
jgi:hypothetical protein